MLYSFSNLEPVSFSMSGSNCCFLTHIQVSQETGKVIWDFHQYFHLLRIFHSLLWSTHSVLVKSMNQKQMFFWNSLVLSMIQWMLAIWSLSSFLNENSLTQITVFDSKLHFILIKKNVPEDSGKLMIWLKCPFS